MKLIKYFVVLILCFLTWAYADEAVLEIDIGDYENQLAAWNSRNMLDYQLFIHFSSLRTGHKNEEINVKDGIPETLSSLPYYWAVSTVPEIYSFITEEVKKMKTDIKSGEYDWLSLTVKYDTECHYPKEIKKDGSFKVEQGIGKSVRFSYNITVIPAEAPALLHSEPTLW
ncbi:MAG: DUF6174 domain-containing protein [Treponema sp.]|nr:DUF6174 domain-containing protein [Treponema sp.]